MSGREGGATFSPQLLSHFPGHALCSGCPDVLAYQQALQRKQIENDELHAHLSVLESKSFAAQYVAGQCHPVTVGETHHVPTLTAPEGPAYVYPQIRMIMADTQGLQVEPTLNPAFRCASGSIHTQQIQMSNVFQGSSHSGQSWQPHIGEAVEHIVTSTLDSTPDRYVYMGTDTMPEGERNNMLSWALKELKEKVDKMKQELDKVHHLNHNLLSQLNAANTERNSLKDQVASQASEILDLKSQNQQLRELVSCASLLRAGTKRGRFLMSSPKICECTKCHWVFESEKAAVSSRCAYHPMPACRLLDKMVGELYEGELLGPKHRYWPCCKKISIETPVACHGEHQLRMCKNSA